MKYSLRSLMIAAMLLPPLLAGAYFCLTSYMPVAQLISAVAFIVFIVALLAFLFPGHHRHL